MKLNKWTVGLAAVGAVSLASVAKADEAKMGSVLSSSSTILSGYVDTSMQWNLGDGNTHAPAYKYGGAGKADGFNLDAVMITLEKPLDESEWAAGYRVDLFLGPDAATLGSQSTLGVTGAQDFAIKQAYVILNAPVGNGLDFKVGVFDAIIGYESTEGDKNPNFTRSWGHTIEPSTHTGVLATYHINSSVAVSAGLANTLTPSINGRAINANGTTSESSKTYMGAVALTAPDDWGFLAGSTLDGGIVQGQQNNVNGGIVNIPQTSCYAGVTLNTPVTGLRGGFSWDYARAHDGARLGYTAHSFAAYASYQVQDTKLSFHERVEYADLSQGTINAIQLGTGGAGDFGIASAMFSFTSTVQYDLWKNVLSRVEFRWDRTLDGTRAFGGSGGLRATGDGREESGTFQNSFIIAANVIYKF